METPAQLVLAQAILGFAAATIPFVGQLLTMLKTRTEQRNFTAKAKSTLKLIGELKGTGFDRTLMSEAEAALNRAFSRRNYAIMALMSTVNEWAPAYSSGQSRSNLGIAMVGGLLVSIDWPGLENISDLPGLDTIADPIIFGAMGISTFFVNLFPKQMRLVSAEAEARKELFIALKVYFEQRFFILITQGTLPYLLRELDNDVDDQELGHLLKRAAS